jgi:hypothetical protein
VHMHIDIKDRLIPHLGFPAYTSVIPPKIDGVF